MACPRRSVVPLLACLCFGVHGAAPLAAVDGPEAGRPFDFYTPDVHQSPSGDGSIIALQGFTGHLDGRRVIGDAFRFHLLDDDLFIQGRVVYVMPGVRIEADRLGFHPRARTGEAWQVRAGISAPGRTLRVSAAHVAISRTRLVFSDVEIDSGHGGFVAFRAPTITVDVHDPPRADREGVRQHLDGVGIASPTVRLAGVPVLWLPYLYRDFVLDYPWTRVVAGHSKRQGDFARYWLGVGLPAIAGWKTRIEGRVERNVRAGNGYGADLLWRHQRLGAGQATWFEMPSERVTAAPDDNDEIARRRARVIDLEHRVGFSALGGAGAAYARWLEIPGADPVGTGTGTATGVQDDRFRADYLHEDVEHRPFARRGVALAYSLPLGSITVDSGRSVDPDLPASERWLGLQLDVPVTRIIGPLHGAGSGWVEDLHRTDADTAAVRSVYDVAASAVRWLGGAAVDGALGVRGLRYDDGRIAGIAQDGADHRALGYADAGVRVRLVGDSGDLGTTVSPRLGIEVLGGGHGDVLPAYGFRDPRDRLDEDRRYLTAGAETALTSRSAGRTLFRATVVSRWALRPQDRTYTDPLTGASGTGSGSLADVSGTVEGDPVPDVLLAGSFAYDARLDAFTGLDARATWILDEHVVLRHLATLVPQTATTPQLWRQQPGVTVTGFRYRLDGGVTLRPDGSPIDAWSLLLTRHLVEGRLLLSYDFIRDEQGVVYDRRVGIGFTLGAGAPPRISDDPPTALRSFSTR